GRGAGRGVQGPAARLARVIGRVRVLPEQANDDGRGWDRHHTRRGAVAAAAKPSPPAPRGLGRMARLPPAGPALPHRRARRRRRGETEARLPGGIGALEAELVPLQRAANEAEWQLNVTGEDRWEEESTRLRTEIRSVLSRPDPYRQLKEALESDGVDPLLRR